MKAEEVMVHRTAQRNPSFLANRDSRLIVFCGKGGVGKTTSAAAAAVCLAELCPERKILVVSIDPAHSLGDSFDCSLGPERTLIGGTHNLWAVEMDPPGLMKHFKQKHRRQIKRIIERASILHQVDIKEFLSFSLPEMDEMMTFMEIAGMLQSTWDKPSDFDLIIMDTPPTGHLLKLLSALASMDKWVDVFNAALNRYFYFRGSPKKSDFVNQFVENMRSGLERVSLLLKNAREAEFVPVMIPESLSISETEDLLAALEERQIPVSSLIINRVPEDGGCPFCSPRAEAQEDPLAEIDEKFGRYNLIRLPLFPHEIRGKESLAGLAEILLSGEDHQYRRWAKPVEPLPDASPVAAAKMWDLLERDLRFILFGGKGGVGKTSIAAATALYAARQRPNRKMLIYSVDPAHSLADSFDCPIGNTIVSIPGVDNLCAAEIDAEKLREDFMAEYKQIIVDAFDTWEKKRGVKAELRFDRNIIVTLAKTCPPGLGEVLALERVLELAERQQYDLYVLDTAPTGHVLELLEFPQLVRDWLSKAYRGLAKHDREMPLANLQVLGDKIMKSTIAMRKIRAALTDPQQTEFVAITIPEAMGIAETGRLLTALGRLGIPCHHIAINMIVPATQCASCDSKGREQLQYLQELMDMKSPDQLVSHVPLFPHEITGMDDLTELGSVLYGQQ